MRAVTDGFEVAEDDPVEVVPGLADPVVGDSVLREMNRFGLRCERSPEPIKRPALLGSFGAGAVFEGLARRGGSGGDASPWPDFYAGSARRGIAQTIPLGRWVRRTADSVLFWCWPPGTASPHHVALECPRGWITISTSSGSGKDGNSRGRGVDSPLGLGRRDSLDPVAAALELEVAEGTFTVDPERGFLEAAEFGRDEVEDLEGPAVGLGDTGGTSRRDRGRRGRPRRLRSRRGSRRLGPARSAPAALS